MESVSAAFPCPVLSARSSGLAWRADPQTLLRAARRGTLATSRLVHQRPSLLGLSCYCQAPSPAQHLENFSEGDAGVWLKMVSRVSRLVEFLESSPEAAQGSSTLVLQALVLL